MIEYIQSLPVPSFSLLPSFSPSDIVSFVVAMILVVVIFALIERRRHKTPIVVDDVERIERVRAYIFFPIGTLEENKSLDYHEKHFHKRLIVNFKTKTPEAYPLPVADTCYGWKMIRKYPDMWVSVKDSIYPNPDNQGWCDERVYHLNPCSASKEELLKTDALNVELKESIGKVEEKSPLIEVYSPIHAMIIRIYSEVPHSPRDTVGSWVKKSLIDINSISALFNQHVHELGDNNLKMWLGIEKDIKEQNGFFLTIYRQKWFDELEAEYNRLTKH